ncbi:MAG: SH3 domain-containing protein [Deltaproteobacteria bacterium]
MSLIALFCFAVGLAWPLLAGLDFVQRPPGTNPIKPEESEPPPLESEPDSKPSSPPAPRPGAPVSRDEGMRAAAHLAPLATTATQRDGKPASGAAERAESGDRIAVVSGQATIVWKAAVVRESPSSQAETLDRLLRGSRIAVTGRKGDWYRVKYGRPARTGWVHHKALGL